MTEDEAQAIREADANVRAALNRAIDHSPRAHEPMEFGWYSIHSWAHAYPVTCPRCGTKQTAIEDVETTCPSCQATLTVVSEDGTPYLRGSWIEDGLSDEAWA